MFDNLFEIKVEYGGFALLDQLSSQFYLYQNILLPYIVTKPIPSQPHRIQLLFRMGC